MFYVYNVTVGIRPREVDFSRHPDPQTREHYRRAPRYLSTRDADPTGVIEKHPSKTAAVRAVRVLNEHSRRHGLRDRYAYVDGARLGGPVPPRRTR